MAGKTNYNENWVIDSGASEHITCDESLLIDKQNYEDGMPVIIPNGDIIPMKEIGTSMLPNGLRINRVLHIPEFKCNLLSVSRMTKDLNCSVTFYPNFCMMQVLRSRKLIGVGRCSDGLYSVKPNMNKRAVMAASVDVETWHRRLGHASDI